MTDRKFITEVKKKLTPLEFVEEFPNATYIDVNYRDNIIIIEDGSNDTIMKSKIDKVVDKLK